MSAETVPKEFEKTSEVLPFTKYGISSFEEFINVEKDVQHVEWLKRVGLTDEEIKLYQDNEVGLVDQKKKVESTVLKSKLDYIYAKINKHLKEDRESESSKEEASTSKTQTTHERTIPFYPEGHPMNELQQLEDDLFGHLKTDIIPITKRRKILRRFERKKARILAQQKLSIPTLEHPRVATKGSLWDVTEKPVKTYKNKEGSSKIIGPKRQTMYTIKDNKIMRLEPVKPSEIVQENSSESPNRSNEYRAVDIVLPVNSAEEQLLEGTKMCVDDIRNIERFKDYEPGVPSKVLYIKNISPSVTQEQLALLFNQFQLENGGPIEVRLLSGRMREQAFVSFQAEELAVRALDEVNGTILSGKPIVVQFGRNSNRIQDDNR